MFRHEPISPVAGSLYRPQRAASYEHPPTQTRDPPNVISVEYALIAALTNKRVPPALPGRQQKFDIYGGRIGRSIDEAPNHEPPSTRKGVPSMDDYENVKPQQRDL
jgi:hypothetical protein